MSIELENVAEKPSEQSVVMPLSGECDFIGQRYKIRTIKDLYCIPIEKLPHCLIDLMASIESHKALVELSGVHCLPLEEVEWVDDGKHDLAIEIKSA
jgi:hypothetical protein